MNDTALSRTAGPVIPSALGWGLMQKIVDVDMLLKLVLNTGVGIDEVGDLARTILDQAATDLSAALMPDVTNEEAGVTYPNAHDQSNHLLEVGLR